jgi:predicted porin
MQVKRLAAALVAATPLFAAAQTNVTLYGVVDAAIESSDNGTAGRHTMVQSGDQSTSRIGFRGTEDLGNGLKAIFNLEAGIAIDTGNSDMSGTNSALFQRRAVVGLEGAFGTLTLGREYSPVASVAAASDEFGQGFYGSNLSAFGTASPNTGTSYSRLTRRLANSVNYKSASWAGFKLLAAYAAGENTDLNAPGSSSRDLKSLGAEYTLGNLYIGGAYAETKRLNINNDKEYAIGAAYKFDQFGGLDIKGNYMVADAYGPNNRFTQWNLGAGFPFGASKVLANFQQNKLQNGAKGKVWAVAYTYSLSKRTNVYASYADLNNNNLGTFGLNSSGNSLNPATTSLGADPSAFTIGIRHTF